jgi:hypothetical protein
VQEAATSPALAMVTTAATAPVGTPTAAAFLVDDEVDPVWGDSTYQSVSTTPDVFSKMALTCEAIRCRRASSGP